MMFFFVSVNVSLSASPPQGVSAIMDKHQKRITIFVKDRAVQFAAANARLVNHAIRVAANTKFNSLHFLPTHPRIPTGVQMV